MIRRLLGSRLLRLFSTSIATQAMLSAANLAIGLLLIRYAEDAQYGHFVLVQTSLMLLVTAQGAWISGPVTVLALKKTEPLRREMVGTVEQGQRRFVNRAVLLALSVPLFAYALGHWAVDDLALAIAAVFAAWMTLRREYLRTALLVYFRPDLLFVADALYVGVLFAGTLMAILLPGPAAAWTVLSLSAAAALAAWFARRAIGRTLGWTVAAESAPVWREMRPLGSWAVMGATISWIYMQSYNYVLAISFGVIAVAHVNAARLMLMPTVLLQVGVEKMLVPYATGWLHGEGLRTMLRRTAVFAVGLALIDAMYLAMLWPFRDWITDELMRKQIVDRDLMVLLWGLNFILAALRGSLLCALVALERFQQLAWMTALSAVVSILATLYCIQHYGPAGAVMGTVAGEVAGLIGVLVLAAMALRRQAAPPAAAET